MYTDTQDMLVLLTIVASCCYYYCYYYYYSYYYYYYTTTVRVSKPVAEIMDTISYTLTDVYNLMLDLILKYSYHKNTH
jgi:hypothetical protein